MGHLQTSDCLEGSTVLAASGVLDEDPGIVLTHSRAQRPVEEPNLQNKTCVMCLN